MLDILSDYLRINATPEIFFAITNALRVLDDFNVEDYDYQFETILMQDGSVDNGETLTSIMELAQHLQNQLLKEHSVLLTNEASLDLATDILAGILALPQYENKTEVMHTANLDGCAEEVFCELLALVTKYSVEELLPYFESVNPSLLTRIKELSSIPEEALELDDIRIMRQRHIVVFNRFCKYIHTRTLHVSRLLAAGVDVGYPFAIYVNMIGRDLETLDVKIAAQELIGMAFCSSDGLDNPRGIIKEHIDKYIASLDAVTKITIIVSDLLLGFEK